MFGNYYDVIIIGGGPAGSSCGIFLKKMNPSLRVCIIDRQKFPRKKTCGDGLSPGVINIINEAGLGDFFLDKFPISLFTFSNNKSFQIKYDLRRLQGNSSFGFVCPRELFDNVLIKHASALHVDIFEEHEILKFEETCTRVTNIISKYCGNIFTFSGRVVIGADGANSEVRKYLGIPTNNDKNLGISLRYYCKYKSSEEASLQIEIPKNLKYSYAWIFPISEHTANIGIGVDINVYKKNKISLNKEFTNFFLNHKDRMQLELIPKTRAGYLLPYGNQMPQLNHKNKILIGDAASMINPLTGEGIYYAMHAGQHLAYYLASSFTTTTDGPEDALQMFATYFTNWFQNHYKLNLNIKKMISSPFSDILMRIVQKDTLVLDKLMNIIMGNDNHLNSSTMRLKVVKKIISSFV